MKWSIINNNSHTITRYTSERKLRNYARSQGWHIKRSHMDYYCFYIESYEYLPS